MALKTLIKKTDCLFLPSFCVNCHQETPEEPPSLRWLCFSCHGLLNPRWEKDSLRPEIESLYFIFNYEKDRLAQKLIQALKYNFVKEIAASLNVALEKERLNFSRLDFEIITPIPLHRRRLKERGFNQSRLIADKISEITGREVLAETLSRTGYRRHQAGLKKQADREKNILNIFTCRGTNSKLIAGRTILLVDDVATTGATLREAARVLKSAGAAKVIAFTLARD